MRNVGSVAPYYRYCCCSSLLRTFLDVQQRQWGSPSSYEQRTTSVVGHGGMPQIRTGRRSSLLINKGHY